MTKSIEVSYAEALLLLDLPINDVTEASGVGVGASLDEASTVTVVDSRDEHSPEYPKSKLDQGEEPLLLDLEDQDDKIDASVFLAASLLDAFQQHASSLDHDDLPSTSSQNKVKSVRQYRDEIKKVKRPNYQKVYERGVRSCSYCQATVTPMWRHGPPGFEDLCNKVFISPLYSLRSCNELLAGGALHHLDARF